VTNRSSGPDPSGPDVLGLVDESYRDGVYLLAFCLVARNHVEETRAALRALPRHARPRFHWNREQHKDRLVMVDSIAEMGVPRPSCTRPAPRRGSRNRPAHGCWRSASRDGLFPASAPFAFARPGDEPLLWLPDAVAGAVGLMLAGGGAVYADRLPSSSWTLREVPRA